MRSADPKRASEISAIAAKFDIADIYVFGSRAHEISSSLSETRSQASESDIDIAARPRNHGRLSPADRVALTRGLENALDAGSVDLLVLQEASPLLALSAIRGNLLYCADPIDQAEYELFVLRRAGDLIPLERDRQRIIFQGGR